MCGIILVLQNQLLNAVFDDMPNVLRKQLLGDIIIVIWEIIQVIAIERLIFLRITLI